MRKIEALYIHIPFCDHICIYCDFYKMIASQESQNKYIDYLIKELQLKKDYFKELKTIYIGGGTPSTLSISNLNKLFNFLNNYINMDDIVEYTIECNPNDITDEFINLIMENHVNRISLGVQSLTNKKLEFLNRNHNHDIVINSLDLLNKHNFKNISCDLIYGVNFDTFDLIKEDLETLINHHVKHISCYSLIIEDKTILNKMIKEKKYQVMDDDLDYEIYTNINEYLENLGYKQYEISNYSIPGYESIHNLTYWNDEYYIGIGANASYYYNHTRFRNYDNLNKYYDAIDNYNINNKLNTIEENKLSFEDEMSEFIMLGLRKVKGINKDDFFNRFNYEIKEKFPNIRNLINNNLLIENNNYICINHDKLYIMNSIINKLFEE